jgi:hypothetical protein
MVVRSGASRESSFDAPPQQALGGSPGALSVRAAAGVATSRRHHDSGDVRGESRLGERKGREVTSSDI